jgi:tetratricopeptide (TPR) repeat protein
VNKGVPRALEAICRKTMAFEPEQRYGTAKELAADVEQWLADQPVTVYREPWIAKARRWLGRHRTLATATLTALLAATASLTVATILLKAAYDRESKAKVDAEDQRNQAEANLRLVLLGLQGVTQLGESYDQKDISKEAEAAYSLAITLAERITQAYPDNPEYQSLLAQSYHNLGDRYGATRQIEKAETFDRKALAVWEPLVRAHPEVSAYTVGLGRTYGTMGHLLLYRKNQPQEALTWHDRAIPLLETVLAATPRDALARQVLSRAYTSRAYALNKLHRYREAVADWERAIKLEDDPTRRARWRIHLAWTLRQVQDYARAVEEAETASRSANLSDSELVDLASTFGVAASAARRTGSEPQAQEHIRHAFRLLERAADKGYFKDPANIRELKTDTDFEALQSRPDFPQLLKRLEAPPPRK